MTGQCFYMNFFGKSTGMCHTAKKCEKTENLEKLGNLTLVRESHLPVVYYCSCNSYKTNIT